MKTLKSKIVLLLIANQIIIFAIIAYINHTNQKHSISGLSRDNFRALLWFLNEQVKILMLNGVNEEIQALAARAGEQGRGGSPWSPMKSGNWLTEPVKLLRKSPIRFKIIRIQPTWRFSR
ncbi:MAG: hypothetical protein JXA92_01390 [candidate division Zixibacteria bacterium]|nr:hypothetical protein [candidate division Zixibacteria bacterium]